MTLLPLTHKFEYKIAVGRDCVELELEVNFFLGQGWLPIGSICIDVHEIVYQAMIREREDTNAPPP
jgi:hypothetical protein